MTASSGALEGPQGFLAAMASEHASLEPFVSDLGARWEIVETGITVKLYPSCAGTHPTLDALLDLQRRDRFSADDVDAVDIAVGPITPTVLIYERPATGLQAKFSMPFCAAAAIAFGRVDIETFDDARIGDPRIARLQARVQMTVDATLDASAPALTQSRVTVRLNDGRVLTAAADGARGYPDRPPSDEELDLKFLSCARRVLDDGVARDALAAVRRIESAATVRSVMASLGRIPASTP